MIEWANRAQKEKSELFEPLLIPKIDEDELLFLNQALDQIDVDWIALPELSREQRKAVRFDYNRWCQTLNDTLTADSQALESDDASWKKDFSMLALQPEHVQLFGNVHSVKTKKWKIAWGLELNNYKQNHLEPYATRGVTESPAVEQVDLVQAGQPLNADATVDDGPENPAPRFESSELGVAEDVPLKHWFLQNRRLLTAFAFLLLFIGLLDSFIF